MPACAAEVHFFCATNRTVHQCNKGPHTRYASIKNERFVHMPAVKQPFVCRVDSPGGTRARGHKSPLIVYQLIDSSDTADHDQTRQ